MASAENENQSDLAAAELKKARAEAALAAANAAKAALEEERAASEKAEWDEGKKIRQQAAAADVLAKQMANETTRRSWIADMVPDLTKVNPGSLQGTDKPLFTALLASRALNDAAEQLFADKPLDGHVFLTTDHSLVDRLAIYTTVENEIMAATELVEAALAASPSVEGAKDVSPRAQVADVHLSFGAAPVIAAVAAALPGALSLFSSRRTLAGAEVTQDAYVTMVAVAGALFARENPPVVIMDETRVLSGKTKIEKAFAMLHQESMELAAVIELLAANDRADVQEWWAKASAVLNVVRTAIDALTKGDEKTGMSTLTQAASQEVLTDPALKHIIVVTPAGSSTAQLINDRPFWFKDTFNVVTTAAIAFVRLDPQTGQIKDAGISTGSDQLNGKIGDKIHFNDEDTDRD